MNRKFQTVIPPVIDIEIEIETNVIVQLAAEQLGEDVHVYANRVLRAASLDSIVAEDSAPAAAGDN